MINSSLVNVQLPEGALDAKEVGVSSWFSRPLGLIRLVLTKEENG